MKDFKPEEYIPGKELRRMDLFIQYALAATKVAIQDAGLDLAKEDAERVGVIVGTGLGGLPTLEKYHSILLERGPGRISPFFIPMLIANEAPGQHSDTIRHKRAEPEHRHGVRHGRAFA